MADDKDGVLSDHRRDRTKFIPPFADSLGDQLQPVNWLYEEVPELLWVGLLFEKHTPPRAMEITEEFAQTAQDLFGEGEYVFSFEYDKLSDDDFQEMRDSLAEETVNDFSTAVAPLAYHYPSFPQSPLVGAVSDFDEDSLGILQEVVNEMADRRSRRSMLVQTSYIYTALATDQVMLSEGVEIGDINDIMDYPDTDESRRLASVVRAATKAMRGSRGEDDRSDWASRFWERGFEISDCVFPQQLENSETEADEEGYPDDEFFEELVSIGVQYEERLLRSLIDLWWEADHDPDFAGKHAVLDALLMRQVSLATNLATSFGMWSYDVGCIILRCMSDTQVTLAWFDRVGEQEDYQSFIEYGLGQEKLYLEHSGEFFDQYEGDAKGIDAKMERLEKNLEEQRASHLLPVDVGGWNKDTRSMAQEADCEDMYNLRFSRYSSTVHGTWNALEQQYLVKCHNPLHSYHRIPDFRGPARVPFTIVEVGNIMNRSLDSWASARNVDLNDAEIIDLAATVKDLLRDRTGLEI